MQYLASFEFGEEISNVFGDLKDDNGSDTGINFDNIFWAIVHFMHIQLKELLKYRDAAQMVDVETTQEAAMAEILVRCLRCAEGGEECGKNVRVATKCNDMESAKLWPV
ncbi:hypothetical protein Zm00014a_016410 [Zea mays]|uniref:DUF6857 domain-containing protein n=2 Tax=Zea mays TaxID=4577 RepID=A0A3L6E1D4_MAIZE|nr:hypothetical protein ZEAMMB73_Zm00001d021552 [Zea mays]PWZ14308.1 hypothetical protein Zm00014a_016410 [Zea mays]